MKALLTYTQAKNELMNVCFIRDLNQFLEDALFILMLYLTSTRF